MKRFVCFLLFCALLSVGGRAADTLCRIKVFENTRVHYNPDLWKEVAAVGDTLRMAEGRIVLHRVKLPRVRKPATLHAVMRLRSAGDPWDKTGSCFVLPARGGADMLELAGGRGEYQPVDTAVYGALRGAVASGGFTPPVELVRFMTPFGVGAFSEADSLTTLRRMPVYVDGFAPFVEWRQDVSDRLPVFADEVYVGVYIDTWTKEGYSIDLDLVLLHGSMDNLTGRRGLMHLLNTMPYYGQPLPDEWARRSVPVRFELPRGARRAKLHYIVTGHGGHYGGDEFVPKENVISIDGAELARFTPWRNDCASFRRFNPSTGVWLRKREVSYIGGDGRNLKEVEEPIASSDLSRSGWCPGSDVPPLVFDLPDLAPGLHTIDISIPDAAPAVGDLYNHWIVSTWITWEE